MFTVYFDDSGTSPSQRVAVAAALVVPNKQIIRMEKEWDALKAKESFSSFHTSEFIARNPRSDFANWDSAKQARVFKRVRQISKKYGIKALSFTVNKQSYEEAIPNDMRVYLGKFHYTWAVRHLISIAEVGVFRVIVRHSNLSLIGWANAPTNVEMRLKARCNRHNTLRKNAA